nr:8509_t:CDS:2 [Entrophospora candida]
MSEVIEAEIQTWISNYNQINEMLQWIQSENASPRDNKLNEKDGVLDKLRPMP